MEKKEAREDLLASSLRYRTAVIIREFLESLSEPSNGIEPHSNYTAKPVLYDVVPMAGN